MKKVNRVRVEEIKTNCEDVRIRIIKAAITLLKERGRDALTTRGVADAAKIQAPTLYRLFGDKRGLLDAVAEYGYVTAFNRKKELKTGPNPIDDLRHFWDGHISFGLENPVLYSLMFGELRTGFVSPTDEKCRQVLGEFIHRIAVTGRLKVNEKHAAKLIFSVSSGVVLALLAMPEGKRDLNLARDAREVVIAAITTDSQTLNEPGAEGASIALLAMLPNVKSLTDGERHLLAELLERISIRG